MFATLIPCYNEAENIALVIREVHRKTSDAHVIVVNDGSSDDSAQIAAQEGADVISLPFNLGIGAAVQTGYMYALERGFETIVRIDGDGQHDPHDIGDILAPIYAGQADMVVGSRFLEGPGYTHSMARAIGIRYFSKLVSCLTGLKITDPTSGFYACNRSALHFLAKHTPIDYPEIESLILLSRAGYRIVEVPTAMKPRAHGESSIGLVDSLYYMSKVTLAIVIELVRRKPS